MRWQGQRIDTTDVAALPGMERLSGLVRSVNTPEFADITFHEVVSKSALNHVPGPSSMPFAWTVNPYRGCSHACAYCLAPDTLVLAADGRRRRIADLAEGDVVVGTEAAGKGRRYVETTVLAHWSTRKQAYLLTLADGTEVVASGDHRFLTERGWKHVTGSKAGAARRPFLTTDDRLMGFGVGMDGTSHVVEPATLVGTAMKSSSDLRVVSIEPAGDDVQMFDITTGTGDFIANGVISHNCFARGTHEYLDFDAGRDFDTQVVVKVNVAEVLRRELARPSWHREHVALGTNTDPYQRAEGRYRLMPGIITALTESGTPFSILTKGTLLRRDLPLLQDAARWVDVSLAMSIAVFDDSLQRSLEPGTPSVAARLDTVRAATAAGFRVSVFLMPVLPHLTDSIPALDEALRRIKAAGAARVVYGSLHLKPAVKPWFLQWLTRERPELVSSYRRLYPGAAVNAPKDYRRWLSRRIRPLMRSHGLDGRHEDDGPPQPARSRTGPVRVTAKGVAADPAMLF